MLQMREQKILGSNSRRWGGGKGDKIKKRRKKERKKSKTPNSKISNSSGFTRSYKMLARQSTIKSILVSIFLPLLVNRALPF